MTDAEKKLLQAKHRMEEAQARDRVKERKARTRRLIQEGAILEKAMPEVRAMELSDSKPISCRSGNDPVLYAGEPPGNRGLSFLYPKGALTHHLLKQAVVASRWSARALSEGDCVSCGSRRTMPQPGPCCCHRPRSRFCGEMAKCHLTQFTVCLRKPAPAASRR